MKYLQRLCLGALLMASSTPLSANSITAYNNQTAYLTQNFVFHDGGFAQGFVRFNDGFTVLPSSCATMDVLFSVSGGIDLRETSTIRLLKDLKFDSGVTLSTGGNIDGRGHTLILNGDFTIPANKVLHFNGDTILDAQGHEIIIGAHAEIFVDTNVTLTIANATIKTTRNAPWLPALRCGAFSSKLALDNVVFAPADDFLFLGGQFFIHNDVVITGTSSFVYNSPVPSFITKNSCLYLDHGITISMAPATFTDAPYSLKNTYTNNNFIKMADETSVLYLNGCTLQTTFTGWRLTKGTVTFDNRVDFIPDQTLTLTSFSYRTMIDTGIAGTPAASCSWHPEGKYIAITYPDESLLRIFSFDGIALTLVAQNAVLGQKILWSPDGNYIMAGGDAIGGYVTYFSVYKFDGTSLTLSAYSPTFNTGDCAWSPDGKYIVSENGSSLFVYRFDGTRLTVVQQVAPPGNTASVAWSPDGKHIALGPFNGAIRIYDFDGASLTEITTSQQSGQFSMLLTWSPDGRYLLGSNYSTSNPVQLYRFDGNSLALVDQISQGPNDYSTSNAWSPDGRYITLGWVDQIDPLAHRITTYTFDGHTMQEIASASFYCYGPVSVTLHPSMKYLAVVSQLPDESAIYDTHYTVTTTPQALTNSIVFGDSAKGEAHDVHLRLLPGASMNLSGIMLYDNVDGAVTI